MFRAELTRTVGGPQRRMPRHIFSALSILLLLGCACGPACCEDDERLNNVELFVPGKTKFPKTVDDGYPTEYYHFFASPFLVGGKNVMVALAEARQFSDENNKVEIAVKYIGTEGENWADNTTDNNGENWGFQSFFRSNTKNYYFARNPIAVIKGNKIYMLIRRRWSPNGFQLPNIWHIHFAVGEIRIDETGGKIKLAESEILHSKLTQEISKQELRDIQGYSAFLTSKGMIVFSADATKKEGSAPGKPGFAIMQLKDDKEQWEVSFVEKPKECSLFSLFEWKERLISVFSGCSTDTNYVKEHDEVSKEWKDTDDALLYSLSGKNASRDLTPVTIGNKTVLLFTGECSSQSSVEGCAIPLWFTDTIWTFYVGSIETPYTNVTSGGLLYTNDQLFFMYQDTSNISKPIVFARLNHELRRIRHLLSIWSETDPYLSKPCNETAPEDASPDTLCVTPMPTDGLVGFLSKFSSHSEWHDEYHYTAPFVNGRKQKNGFTFSGAAAGAQWRINSGTASVWHNFTKYGLTVVATVAVHETLVIDAPLLTLDGFGSNERLGLWYKDGQWKLVSKNGKKELATDLKTQKEYRVALVLHNNTISAYVNGKPVGGPLPISAPEEKPFNLRNVYIAGYDRGSGIKMTATNVFLYNRVLNDTELEAASRTIAATKRTDSKDNFVCVRMSFTLLFLLGCICLAFFW